jgi:hypothetical protein
MLKIIESQKQPTASETLRRVTRPGGESPRGCAEAGIDRSMGNMMHRHATTQA